MLSHDAGSVQRGTVLETRLVGLHVCSLPSQLLANAAIAASRVASYRAPFGFRGPKERTPAESGAQVNRNPAPSASPLGTLVPALMASPAKFSPF